MHIDIASRFIYRVDRHHTVVEIRAIDGFLQPGKLLNVIQFHVPPMRIINVNIPTFIGGIHKEMLPLIGEKDTVVTLFIRKLILTTNLRQCLEKQVSRSFIVLHKRFCVFFFLFFVH